jgi:signal transduction histidine kinase
MIMLGIILLLLVIVLVFAYRSLTFRSRLNKKLDAMVKEKTKELIESNTQLVKSRSELDSFLYRTSHDIRGPIATLLGLTSLAKLEAKDSLMSTYLEKINVTADKLNEVISRLTNVSQINSQPLNVQDTDVFNTINEVVNELKEEYLNGVSFKLVGPPPSNIKTDKILLKIILENLLQNSFKFSDSKERNSFVKLDIQQNGNLELIVTDNGVGIKSEYKDKIFDLFFVASETERGSGIGLYQALLATQKLNGKIELIHNRKPTKFKLIFPELNKGNQSENDIKVLVTN